MHVGEISQRLWSQCGAYKLLMLFISLIGERCNLAWNFSMVTVSEASINGFRLLSRRFFPPTGLRANTRRGTGASETFNSREANRCIIRSISSKRYRFKLRNGQMHGSFACRRTSLNLIYVPLKKIMIQKACHCSVLRYYITQIV